MQWGLLARVADAARCCMAPAGSAPELAAQCSCMWVGGPAACGWLAGQGNPAAPPMGAVCTPCSPGPAIGWLPASAPMQSKMASIMPSSPNWLWTFLSRGALLNASARHEYAGLAPAGALLPPSGHHFHRSITVLGAAAPAGAVARNSRSVSCRSSSSGAATEAVPGACGLGAAARRAMWAAGLLVPRKTLDCQRQEAACSRAFVASRPQPCAAAPPRSALRWVSAARQAPVKSNSAAVRAVSALWHKRTRRAGVATSRMKCNGGWDSRLRRGRGAQLSRVSITDEVHGDEVCNSCDLAPRHATRGRGSTAPRRQPARSAAAMPTVVH